MERSIFNSLMELPLFLGLGIDDLSNIVEKVKFNFVKIESQKVIAEQYAQCNSLHFLLKGEVRVDTWNDNKSVLLREHLHAPAILQVESLFGLRTTYTHTFSAETNIQMLEIGKQDVIHQLLNFDIFRFNLLNLLSSKAQYGERMAWQIRPKQIEQKFVHLLRSRSIRPAGEKFLRAKMTDLANELDETRLNVSQMLHNLEESGLIQIQRQAIVIPNLEKLISR